MKKEITIKADSSLELQEKAKALEQIAEYFTGKDLLRIAAKLKSPTVRLQIKTFL
jgi:hypothetical protein